MGAGWGAIAGGISDIGQTVAAGVLAKQTRKWMEKMRDTAYQAMVRDLVKADLNPALAFGGGSAHPMGTGTPPMPKIGGFGSSIESGARAGQMIATGRNQQDIIRHAEDKAEADASRAWTEAETAGGRINAEVDLMDSQALRNFQEAQLAISEEGLTSARTKHTQQQEIQTRVNRMLGETELPAARARGDFDSTEFGQAMREFRRIMEVVPGGPRGAFRQNSRY